MFRPVLVFAWFLFTVGAHVATAEPPSPTNSVVSSLRIATFDVDATPPIGSMMAYDPVTNRWDLGLRARGIVLVGAGEPIVLCAVDWIGLANEGHDAFRDSLARAAGTSPRRVAVHTLHQHDAPDCDFSAERILKQAGQDARQYDGSFQRQVISNLETAIRESLSRAQPVTYLGLGEARVEKVASNRRILGPEGKVRDTRWTATTDPKIRAEPEGVIDPVVSLVSFWNGERPMAVLSYYATHPQSYYRTGIPNPDFPGIARFSRQLAVPVGFSGHVQWSRTNPNLISFAGADSPQGDVAGPRPSAGPEDYAARGQRLWVVDIQRSVPRNVYLAEEGELVTHESWWINDQLLFCGGKSLNSMVLSHVKALNIYTGEVRIVGAGAWLPDASEAETARLNWWHAAGGADGRWIAADNWHGDIMLFEGKTTRPHLLTSAHRTYGGGEHPHVGWDRRGEKVVFASHLLGNLNVCVATIPKAWQDAVSANDDGFRLVRKGSRNSE
jgi:hypothetical protein